MVMGLSSFSKENEFGLYCVVKILEVAKTYVYGECLCWNVEGVTYLSIFRFFNKRLVSKRIFNF